MRRRAQFAQSAVGARRSEGPLFHRRLDQADAAIAAELAAHQRAGVPLYLVYKPGAQDPVVLPQILTEKIVLDAP